MSYRYVIFYEISQIFKLTSALKNLMLALAG